LLTIIGYSIHDTIVLFDRVRENVRKNPKKDLRTTVNESINQTLSRTILTSFTVVLVVAVLYIFGGSVINDFAFALLIGVIFGTYSSVAIASPVVLLLKESNHRAERGSNILTPLEIGGLSLFILVLLFGIFSIPFGLPGAMIILADAFLYATVTRFDEIGPGY